MSIHAKNPELEARLQAQRRNSTVASLIIGLLLISLLALIFWAIGVTVFNKTTDPIVAYNSPEPVEDTIEKVKITSQVTKTPTQSASSSAVKVITASAAVSSYSVPSPDEAVESLSLDFGANEGFGQGWGGAGSGFASGGAGGSFSFMGSKMKGDRVCFVMDYSQSMRREGRIELLKEELLKTVESLNDGMNFELIFFAGPAWLSGSEIPDPSAKKTSTVIYENKRYDWICNSVHDWEYKIPRQNGDWEILNESTRRMNLESIRDTPLVWGTDWRTPLTMALEMKPAPDLVVFLTDGLCGGDSVSIAEEIGRKAKNVGVQVNTIALMEPRARDAMAKLATITGGTFALIDQAGNKVDQPMAK